MRKLLNVLYITTEDAYATLDGENVAVKVKSEVKARFPLHILEGIYIFSYAGASPALIGKCAAMNIDLVFCRPSGYFLARPTGRTKGNVLLRREQYRIADDEDRSARICRNMIFGKVMNEKHVLDRMIRDHADRISPEQFQNASGELKDLAEKILSAENRDTIRGLEGTAASIYFSTFDAMILKNKEDFFYHGRNRRPPLDRVNCLLSYIYMMLTSMCSSALEAVGLDPYVGVMHTDRAGRVSLSLDLIEEFRPVLADRFVLTVINNGVLTADDFIEQEDGAIQITEDGRKTLQQSWQKRKQETLIHPFLNEKIEWGLVPYVQAMLLARYIRGDLDGYPPFVWR